MAGPSIASKSASLLEGVRNAGVVGAGGAGFPTHVKLDCSCGTVIANGAECEPLLMNDKYLLTTAYAEVLKGLSFAMEAVSAERGIIAVKKRDDNAYIGLKEAVAGNSSLELLELDHFYPAGDEQVLVYEATGQVVPEGGLPLDVDSVVLNVETLYNLALGAEKGMPVVRRRLTCAGAVKKPGVVYAQIGTPIRDVLALCGGASIENYRIIIGGPMMGAVENDSASPVTKLTSGIIVLPEDHKLIQSKTLDMSVIVKRAKAVCCQCTYCTEMCPRYLLGHKIYPHKIMRAIAYGIDISGDIIKGALLCSECGLCEAYACVMGLSPARVNSMLKKMLQEAGVKSDFKDLPPAEDVSKEALSLRQYRLVPRERILQRLDIAQFADISTADIVRTDSRRVELLLQQHIGAPAAAVVAEGDTVEEGDLVGEIPEGKLGARVHSSVSGKVLFQDEERIVISR